MSLRLIIEDYEGYLAMGSEMQNIYISPEYNIVVAMTASVVNDEHDISEEIIRRVRLAVTEFVPTSEGSQTDLLIPLTIVGVASVSAIVLVLGVRRLKR